MRLGVKSVGVLLEVAPSDLTSSVTVLCWFSLEARS